MSRSPAHESQAPRHTCRGERAWRSLGVSPRPARPRCRFDGGAGRLGRLHTRQALDEELGRSHSAAQDAERGAAQADVLLRATRRRSAWSWPGPSTCPTWDPGPRLRRRRGDRRRRGTSSRRTTSSTARRRCTSSCPAGGSYADIHAADARSDLAVLKLIDPPPKLQAIKFADVRTARPRGRSATVFTASSAC